MPSDAVVFPPPYRPLPVIEGDAFARACAEAAAGADDGTLVWSGDPRRLDCAIVLEKDHVFPAVSLALLALADAVGAVGPPNVQVAIGQTDRLLVNGAVAGGVRLAFPTGEAMVIGATVDILGDPDDEPGRHPERTALREEGFDEMDTAALAVGFSRYFLLRLDRWQEGGR
ncbi:MAG TPA: biotin/lipoate--protein ligase family protein [Azospirillaceae bacterium]|nr:biotin/lipoate--protein ligase family protein [Azospirillaceae bacterium]